MCTTLVLELITEVRKCCRNLRRWLKLWQNKKGQIYFWAAPKMMSFSELPPVNKRHHFWCSSIKTWSFLFCKNFTYVSKFYLLTVNPVRENSQTCKKIPSNSLIQARLSINWYVTGKQKCQKQIVLTNRVFLHVRIFFSKFLRN